MSSRRRIHDELDLVLDQLGYGDEDIEYILEVPDVLVDVWLLRSMADRFLQAARVVRDRYDTAAAHILGEGGVARFGEDFIRYSRPNDYVLTDGGRAWLATLETREVLEVLPKPASFRKGGLEAVAARHGEPADALEGSLYINRRVDKDPKLTVQPIGHERTPKYASTMKSGEVRRRR